MAREFVTRGGEEIIVETGTGLIVTLEHAEGKRNARATIHATHTHLREPVTGWIDTHDAPSWTFAQRARDEGIDVRYRIEVHRIGNASKDTPLADLPSRSKVRDLVLVEPSSSPAEPPAVLEEAKPPNPPPPDPARRPGPKLAEGRPYEPLNSDGSVNVGSYAVTGTLAVLDLALEVIIAAGLEPTPALLETLGRSLLRVVDAAQASARADGRTDRNAPSHMAARRALRSAMRIATPDAAHASPDTLARWEDRATRAATTLLRLSVALSDADYRSPEDGNR